MNQLSIVVVVMLIMVHTEAIEAAFRRNSENNYFDLFGLSNFWKENHMGETFLSNVTGCVSATLLKTNSNADIFRNFFKLANLLVNGYLF